MIGRLLIAALLASGAITACGGDDAPVGFGASGAWSRPTPVGATNGVLYLTVSSDVDDALVGVDVPTDVAGEAQLHETIVSDDGGAHSHGGGDGGEVMSMGEVDTFPIDAASRITFAPGGNHVMLVDLVAPLETGERYTATLRFSSGRALDVEVVVADNPPDT